jgi:glycosyltransferase involved in cell wall biosynthesis
MSYTSQIAPADSSPYEQRSAKRRLLILSEIISPYRIPVFNALAKHAGIDLRVVFLAETDTVLRQWQVYKDEIHFPYQVLGSWRLRTGPYNLLLNWGLRSSLRKFLPETIICGGYNYFASWEALAWRRRHNAELILWSESNQHDTRTRHPWVESLKSRFLSGCDSFVVPGIASREYLQSLGAARENIVTAPNAVDNAWFRKQVENARTRPSDFRMRHGLPNKFLLFVGRLIREKGIVDLLEAYAKLDRETRSNVGLVFAGNGPCRRALEREARKIDSNGICFPGFAQREDLAGLYALAEALILPTHSDPWGLVVNEAMACGLPIIVTNVAGCTADLVEDSWNGYVVPARDSQRLSAAIASLLRDSDLRQQMGNRSSERILNYSPEACAQGLAAAALASSGQVR